MISKECAGIGVPSSIKDDVVWNGENWQFKNEGTGGVYVNIDHYDPRLKV